MLRLPLSGSCRVRRELSTGSRVVLLLLQLLSGRRFVLQSDCLLFLFMLPVSGCLFVFFLLQQSGRCLVVFFLLLPPSGSCRFRFLPPTGRLLFFLLL
jgi:hypothetical protein